METHYLKLMADFQLGSVILRLLCSKNIKEYRKEIDLLNALNWRVLQKKLSNIYMKVQLSHLFKYIIHNKYEVSNQV